MNLFHVAETLYGELFLDEEMEPFANFKRYVKDSARVRQHLAAGKPHAAKYLERHPVVDTLAVAFGGGRPIGFLFFSWYPSFALVFVSYLGFRESTIGRRPFSWFDSVPQLIEQERQLLNLVGSPIEAAVFELERFDPGDVKRRTTALTSEQASALDRAKLTRVYQDFGGASLIPWIWYRQPPLTKGGLPSEMHLMYWPVGPAQRQSGSTILPDGRVKEIVKFVYERLYLDGYLATEPASDRPYWERLMRRYSREALRYLPHGAVRLDHIDEARTPGLVFVSYANGDRHQAQLIATRLRTRGIPVAIWPSRGSGATVGAVVNKWIDDAAHILFLITANSQGANGQLDEIKWTLDRRPDADVQIVTNLDDQRRNPILEELGFRVSGPEGLRYHFFRRSSDFHHAVDDAVNSIMESENPTRQRFRQSGDDPTPSRAG